MPDGGRSGGAGNGAALRTRALVLKDGRRTSARLEAPLWLAYDDVCEETGITRGVLSRMIDQRRSSRIGMTSALRVFLLSYFRSAAGRDAQPCAGEPPHHLAAALDAVGGAGTGSDATLLFTPLARGAEANRGERHA